MKEKKRYILYGASFNPPHMGHFSAIRQLLEQYDKVIVFPYPHKHDNGAVEKILPMKTRLKMIDLFISEFFPQISDRLLLLNLADELKQKDKKTEGFLHTYDYLKYVKTKIKADTELHVCLGIDAQNSIKNNSFYKEAEIIQEFGIFKLTEETQVSSQEIRNKLKSKKIQSNKDARELVQYMGYHVSKYIIDKSLYGVVNKQLEYKNKKIVKNPTPDTSKAALGSSESVEIEQKNLLNSKHKVK